MRVGQTLLPHLVRLHTLPLYIIALALMSGGFIQLSLLQGFSPLYVAAIFVWGLCFSGIEIIIARRLPQSNVILPPIVAFLTVLGLLMTARLAMNFLARQIIWLLISSFVLSTIISFPNTLTWLRRFKYTWLVGGLGLLSLTFIFGVNPSGFGARFWLGFWGVFFQPSETLKILIVVFLAVYLSDHRQQMIDISATFSVTRFGLNLKLPHLAHFGPMLLMWGFSILLLFWQGDLGAALLFFCTFLGMLYAAVGQRRYVIVGVLLLLFAGALGYWRFAYVAVRVDGWWNPWLDPDGASFQIVQSLLAFANGGWLGQGLGQGLPTAIPVVHTDFVFAAIGEEYGLLGALTVLTCFGLIVHQAFQISLYRITHFQQLLALGIGLMLGIQALVIAGGTLKLIPLTGVTMPFISYGGSSLLTSFIMIGLLLLLANQTSDKI
ncbi:MAG: FtsW/RodA/SpoVE family cell cycle protein [Chloroflexota bacterium]